MREEIKVALKNAPALTIFAAAVIFILWTQDASNARRDGVMQRMAIEVGIMNSLTVLSYVGADERADVIELLRDIRDLRRQRPCAGDP